MEFVWHEKKYEYEGTAVVFLLAISLKGIPALVARAEDASWNSSNHYVCGKPSYVQLVAGGDGNKWSWPPEIESWLYQLPANLMLRRDDLANVKKRYSSADRATLDKGLVRSETQVDPSFISDNCHRKG